MHRSRMRNIVLDCRVPDLDAAASFWSAALGRKIKPGGNPATDRYVTLGDGSEKLRVFLQRVDHPSHVHLDIETDDLEAELARLERLGARRVQRVEHWWVLEAPTGHRFCLVERPRGSLGEDAAIWD